MSTFISNTLKNRFATMIVLMVVVMAGVMAQGMVTLKSSKANLTCAGACGNGKSCTGSCVCHLINPRVGGICESE